MRRIAALLLGSLVVFGCAGSRAASTGDAAAAAPVREAELVLVGGRVFTGDPANPWAEGLAVQGEKIAAVGTAEAVRKWIGPGTRVVELEGKLVIPGINDAHIHAPWPTTDSVRLKWAPTASVQEILAAVKTATAAHPPGTWLEGSFPRQLLDAALARKELDGVAAAHPVKLNLIGGHASLMNSAALKAWSIGEDAVDPPGGHFGRKDGRLTGWVFEHALWTPLRATSEQKKPDTVVAEIREFEQEALSLGITSVQTMALLPPAKLEELLKSAAPKLRWRVIDFRFAPFDASPSQFPVKYVLDGTPMERGAAIRRPYADAPDQSGRLNYSAEEITQMIRTAGAGAQPLLVHAVGDRALEAVLAEMEKLPEVPWAQRRVRLEHADLLTGDLIERAKRLGVVVVQNPSHFTVQETMNARYGVERQAGHSQVRSLIAAGIPFALGSDGPLSPYLNMLFAATHPNAKEAIGLDVALTAYTAGAAYAEFEEQRKGKLLPGMLADLAVLSQDIFQVPPPELPKTTSVLTVVGGKVVWEAPSAP